MNQFAQKTFLLLAVAISCPILITAGNAASQNDISFTDRLSQNKVAATGASLGAIALLELLLNKNKRDALLGRKSLHRGFLKRLLKDKDTQIASAQGLAGLIALLWGSYQTSRNLPAKPISPVQPQIQSHIVNTDIGSGKAAAAGNGRAPTPPTRMVTPPVSNKPATPALPQVAPHANNSPVAKPPVTTPAPTRTLRRNSKPKQPIAIPVDEPQGPINAPIERKIKTPTPPVIPNPEAPLEQRAAMPIAQPAPTPQPEPAPKPIHTARKRLKSDALATTAPALAAPHAPASKLITDARARLESAGITKEQINDFNERLERTAKIYIGPNTIRETMNGKNIDDELTQEQYDKLLAFFKTKNNAEANRLKPAASAALATPAPAPTPLAAAGNSAPLAATIQEHKGTGFEIERGLFEGKGYDPTHFADFFDENDANFISTTDDKSIDELTGSFREALFKIPFAGYRTAAGDGYCGWRAITGELTMDDGKTNAQHLFQHARKHQATPDEILQGDDRLDNFRDSEFLGEILPCHVIFLTQRGHTNSSSVFIYSSCARSKHPTQKPIFLICRDQQGFHYDRYVQGNSYVTLEIPEYQTAREISARDIKTTTTGLIPQEQLDQADRA